jgi:hypothetical protein
MKVCKTQTFHSNSKQKYTKMNNKQIYSATIFYSPGTKKPRKYKYIRGGEIGLNSFIYFAKKDPEAYYINVYDKQTGIFDKRIWLKSFL